MMLKELQDIRADIKTVAMKLELMAYTSAGDPKLMDEMRQYAIYAAALKNAINNLDTVIDRLWTREDAVMREAQLPACPELRGQLARQAALEAAEKVREEK